MLTMAQSGNKWPKGATRLASASQAVLTKRSAHPQEIPSHVISSTPVPTT